MKKYGKKHRSDDGKHKAVPKDNEKIRREANNVLVDKIDYLENLVAEAVLADRVNRRALELAVAETSRTKEYYIDRAVEDVQTELHSETK